MRKVFILVIGLSLLLCLFLQASAAVPNLPSLVNFCYPRPVIRCTFISTDNLVVPLERNLAINGDLPLTYDWSQGSGFPSITTGANSVRLEDMATFFRHNIDGRTYYYGGKVTFRSSGTSGVYYDATISRMYIYYDNFQQVATIGPNEPLIWHDYYNNVNAYVVTFDSPVSTGVQTFSINRQLCLQDIPYSSDLWSAYSAEYFTDYQTAYDEGFAAGKQEVIEDSEAYENGYNVGYENGASYQATISYSQGFNDGYDKGLEDGNATDWVGWLATSVSGFMSFEIMPGFSIGGLMAVLVSVGLVFAFLRFFAGG